mmetsp:Transcript_50656/g.94677  ORF Transcript_50656/g.94677 Transcript_50656/m.94677 type:complete len:249 (+) Transcript_50656:821-1567(+)
MSTLRVCCVPAGPPRAPGPGSEAALPSGLPSAPKPCPAEPGVAAPGRLTPSGPARGPAPPSVPPSGPPGIPAPRGAPPGCVLASKAFRADVALPPNPGKPLRPLPMPPAELLPPSPPGAVLPSKVDRPPSPPTPAPAPADGPEAAPSGPTAPRPLAALGKAEAAPKELASACPRFGSFKGFKRLGDSRWRFSEGGPPLDAPFACLNPYIKPAMSLTQRPSHKCCSCSPPQCGRTPGFKGCTLPAVQPP